MSINNKLNNLIRLVEQHNPALLHTKKFRDWAIHLQRDPDPDLFEIFEQWAISEIERPLLHPLLHPIPREMRFPNGIHLGEDMNGEQVFLPSHWLCQNALVFGETGAGKTNTLKVIASQLGYHGTATWVFDFKDEYSDLAKHGFVEIAPESLKFNPLNMLDPPNAKRNLVIFQRLFGHSQGLWLASQAFLGKALYQLYKGYNSFDSNVYPSLHELLELIKAIKVQPRSINEQYKERLLNRLEDILLTDYSIFDCSRGFAIEKLVQTNCIFQLRGLKPSTINLLAECLMASLYEYWAARGPQEKLQNAIICDEAKHLFDIRKQYRLRDERPYIDEILAETRAFGIGLVIADQEPSELTPSVEANSFIKIQMRLGSGKDISRMNKAMGLSGRQMIHSYQLDTGQAIVKISGLEPFLMRFKRAP